MMGALKCTSLWVEHEAELSIGDHRQQFKYEKCMLWSVARRQHKSEFQMISSPYSGSKKCPNVCMFFTKVDNP